MKMTRIRSLQDVTGSERCKCLGLSCGKTSLRLEKFQASSLCTSRFDSIRNKKKKKTYKKKRDIYVGLAFGEPFIFHAWWGSSCVRMGCATDISNYLICSHEL